MHVVTGSNKVGVLFVSHKASAKFVPKQKFLMLKIGINHHATVVSPPPSFTSFPLFFLVQQPQEKTSSCSEIRERRLGVGQIQQAALVALPHMRL